MRTIISVQVLRAVAAVSVALCHFNQVQLILSGRGNDVIPLYFLSSGVDLFFVISGFIMVHSSDQLFSTADGPLIFAVRRLARVVPMYWIATISGLLISGGWNWSWSSLFQSLFFVPYSIATGQAVPLLGVGWTLNYEMFFYAIFAFALLLPRKAAVPLVCAILVFVSVVGSEVSIQLVPVRFWFDPIVLEFTFGMGLALIYRRQIVLPWTLRVLMIVVALATIFLTQRHIGGAGLPSGYRFLFWGVPAAMIFAAVVFSPRQRQEGLIWRGWAALGNASYSIYLVHSIAGIVIAMLWGPYLSSFPLIKVLAVGFIGTVLVSLLTYRLIEKRSAAFLSRKILSPSVSHGEVEIIRT
jgi:exopolysaccharide production protein ExoZ